MLRNSFRGCIKCLVGLLLCLSALQVRLNDDDSADVMYTREIKDIATPIFSVHRRWGRSIQASTSKWPTASSSSKLLPQSQEQVSLPTPEETPLAIGSPAPPLLVAPAPFFVATGFAPSTSTATNSPGDAGAKTYFSANKLSTPVSSSPLAAQPNISPSLLSLPPTQPVSPVSAPSPFCAPTPLIHPPGPSSAPPLSSPLLNSPLSGIAPSPSSSAPYISLPLVEPPSNNNTNGMDSPLTSPSSGCCATDMVPKPRLPSDSCICVYPIRMELLIDDVSTNFTNWSSEIQQELASNLDLKVIQIEIISFQFNGPNLSMIIVIAPLIKESFSLQEAQTIKADLDRFNVHFNSSLFGNYTLLHFRYFEPPTLPRLGLSPPFPLPQTDPHDAPIEGRHGRTSTLQLVIGITVSAAIMASVLFLLLLWRYFIPSGAGEKPCRCSVKGVSLRAASSPSDASSYDMGSKALSVTARLFTFDELKQATNNFELASVLGEGGFGRVYKGILKDGTEVAIKRMTAGGHQGDHEFLVEVEMLSRLHHRNLVKLVGYYNSRNSMQYLLCYELISNGSLEAWLHGSRGAKQPLEWNIRMRIALDAARGLAYLHEDSQPRVIHRDFKASNILLENDFHAKVSDFGLAKQAPEGQLNYVSTRVMGTFGYVAPEYAMTGHLLVKSDVYSYGVVLLELLSGRKPVDMSQPPGQENLVTWARPILREKERLGEVADRKLLGRYPREDFAQVAAIAAACVAPEAHQRPSMGEVVQSLIMVQRSSEYSPSEEINASTNNVMCSSISDRSFATVSKNARQPPDIFVSDGSSSMFSSGPFLGLTGLDHDTLSRTDLFSEDLHEGR